MHDCMVKNLNQEGVNRALNWCEEAMKEVQPRIQPFQESR
jgi:hypothetical protein